MDFVGGFNFLDLGSPSYHLKPVLFPCKGMEAGRAFCVYGEKLKSTFQSTVKILSKNDDQHLVFGWFSVIEENGKAVVDNQGDVISEADLEKAAYDFVLNARVAGEMHKRIGVGDLVESMVFTREKQQLLGIDLKKIGWLGGFKITDEQTWVAVKSGKLPAFSISGVAESTPVSEAA